MKKKKKKQFVTHIALKKKRRKEANTKKTIFLVRQGKHTRSIQNFGLQYIFFQVCTNFPGYIRAIYCLKTLLSSVPHDYYQYYCI